MWKLPTVRYKKLFGLLILCAMAVTSTTPNIVVAQVDYDPYDSPPGQLSLLGTTTPEFAKAVYGCEAANSYGAIPALVKAGNKIASHYPGSISTYEEITCVIQDESLSVSQKLDLLNKGGGGGLGSVALAANISILDQRPASGIHFVLAHVEKLSPGVVEAQAQPYFPGSGFQLLEPMQAFWGWSVTISLSFMVLLIVIVAMALMFRARLDGGQVVQLQNAIPGIVMAMILIPLSYPISGLFIDAVTLGTNVIHDFLFTAGGPAADVYTSEPEGGGPSYSDDRGLYADDPRINVFNARGLINSGLLRDAIRSVEFCTLFEGDPICSDSSPASGIYSFVAGVVQFFGGALLTIIGEVIMFIFNVITIITSFKIAWRLFKQFLTLLVLPIAAPFIFATLAIPGRGMSFVMDQFIKKMANAALHFIVTYGLFLLAVVLTTPAFFQFIPNAGVAAYSPPLLNGTIADVQNVVGNAIGSDGTLPFIFLILGAAIFLAIPGILDKLTESLAPKAEAPFLFRAAIDEARASYETAFRQIPAVGATAGGAAFERSVGSRIRAYGARKTTPRGKTNLQTFIENRSKAIAEAERAAATAGNPATKAYHRSRAARLRATGNVQAGVMGKSGAFTPQQGEEGRGIQLEVESLPGMEGSSYGFRTTLADVNTRAGAPGGFANYTGTIVIKPLENATVQGGVIYFLSTSSATGNVIGVLKNDRGAATDVNVILTDGAPATFAGAPETIEITDGSKYFTGNGPVKLKFSIAIPHGGQGAWTLDEDIMVAIGSPESEMTATLKINITVTV